MIKYIPQAGICTAARVVGDFRLIWWFVLVKILTDVVPRLELVGSWTEDELAADLREALQDLGVSQKYFMTILRHALSGMNV